MNPIREVARRMPKNPAQAEALLKGALKVAFWGALLAPVIIVPLYYLVVSLLR